MRAAMAAAEVGDDERDGDPTMRRLEERVAAMLGKEAALFFPSGVMANQAAVWLHCPRGTEVLVDVDAHLMHSEIAGVGALSGAQVLAVNPAECRDDRGGPAAHAASGIALLSRRRASCASRTRTTAPAARSRSLAELQAIRAVAQERGLPVHMDGARLWNASIAQRRVARRLSRHARRR